MNGISGHNSALWGYTGPGTTYTVVRDLNDSPGGEVNDWDNEILPWYLINNINDNIRVYNNSKFLNLV